VSCIPQNERAVLAGDTNGHVGSSNVGYDGMHGGFWYAARNADGSSILAVYRQAKPSHLQHFIHEAGIQAGNICSCSVKSTVDYRSFVRAKSVCGNLRKKICEEYKSMVRDKVEEAEWKYTHVHTHSWRSHWVSL